MGTTKPDLVGALIERYTKDGSTGSSIMMPTATVIHILRAIQDPAADAQLKAAGIAVLGAGSTLLVFPEAKRERYGMYALLLDGGIQQLAKNLEQANGYT